MSVRLVYFRVEAPLNISLGPLLQPEGADRLCGKTRRVESDNPTRHLIADSALIGGVLG